MNTFSWNLPNCLTVSRLFAVPGLVILYYSQIQYSHIYAAALLALAALTDWLDGYLARKFNQTSSFGAFLDPVADKLIVVTALVMLTEQFGAIWFTIPTIIIISREVVISALREWMAVQDRRGVVAVSNLGKIKTTIQLIALIVLFLFPKEVSEPMMWLGITLFYVATVMTLWSMVVYLRLAFRS